ncbi:FecR family protein [Pseudomonas sp. MAFF212428]|uniref:FecR family protein n=1 Tax=Pseudomonas brassicae TaxID=2708063 RepID=A0A6B3NTB5_9PSED|nr:FecR family protein [Pseudomonas brassicae]NER59835.1 FecR family protein [Pseudomonas brassicae]NER62767.1 FecR family protein [Pseudomonas brassicae]
MHDHPSSITDASNVDHVAHGWVVRLTADNASANDVAAARAWCDEHPAHKQAFIAARRLWQLTGQLKAPAPRRTYKRHWQFASAAVLVLGLSLVLVRQNAWDADYHTARGEQRRIELVDGSHLLLDSNSAVDVQFTAHGRTIILRKGEALFDVAHDPQRPFRVEAADLSATALGTVYAVSRAGADTQVTVARGRVKVEDPSGDAVLQAGTRINQTPHGLGPKQSVNVSSALAWQHGRLVFEMTPLSEVLEQLQRYRPGFIQAADERVGNLKVSGTVQLDRLDEGVQSLAQAFALDVVRYSDYWVVLKARR